MRVRCGFYRLFCVLFSLVLAAVGLAAAARWPHNSTAALLVAGGLAVALVLGVRRLKPWLAGLSAQRFGWGMRLAFLAYGALLFWMGQQLAEVLIMDMQVVVDSLPDFLDNFALDAYGGYYVLCNNNLGLALLLTTFYKMMGFVGIQPGTGAGLRAGIALNCAALWLAVGLAVHCARWLTGSRLGQALALGMAAAFAPFVLWTPCFYSDTLCLPFLLAAVDLWLGWQAGRGSWRLWLAGAAVFAGYAVKGSVAVLLVALPVMALLAPPTSVKKAARDAGVFLLCFALLLGGYKLWQNRVLLAQANAEFANDLLPVELWLCYGSHDDGDYSQSDYEACLAQPDVPTRKAFLRAEIANNYAARGLTGNLTFALHKAGITWGDGMYDAAQFLATPVQANWTAFFTLAGQPGYMPLVYYCQVWQYCLLVLAGLSGLGGLWRGKPGGLGLCQLALFGGMLFLSLWETKPRYALQFAPLLILCAVCVVCQMADKAKEAKKPLTMSAGARS